MIVYKIETFTADVKKSHVSFLPNENESLSAWSKASRLGQNQVKYNLLPQ